MTLIYLVVSVILSVMVWVSSQLDWQEEYERTKKYTFFTPAHIIFFAIDILLLIYLWKWNLKDFQTVKYARYKAVVLMNLIQGSVLMGYFKFRDFYTHL